jgi:DNA-binding SARP family transcriptional activator
MASFHFHLLGEFHMVCDGGTIHPIDSNKARELLCYLLLYRRRAHPREVLPGMLWGDLTTAQSRTYLRKALWHIQTAFEAIARDFLVLDTEWVRVNPQIDLWLDTAVLEQAFEHVEGIDGEQIDAATAHMLKEAVEIYDGDLLERWYQDWCLYEHERLQNIYRRCSTS